MKFNRKILSLFTVLTLIVSVFTGFSVSANAADFNPDNVEVYITSDKTTANVGDVVTISVNVNGIQGAFGAGEGIVGVSAGLEYNTSVLEYVENSIKYNTTASVISTVNPKMDANTITMLKSAGVFSAFDKAMRNDGWLVQMKFKVLSKTPTTILLADGVMSDIGYNTFLTYVKDGKKSSIKKNLKIDQTPIKIN